MKQTINTDYGWRFRGKTVALLRDRSFDGSIAPPELSGGETEMPRDVVGSCQQCGICTASCGLADDDALFPRREMSLVQSGLAFKAIASPTIWNCYQCDDCSDGCPAKVKPSEVMADLREKAVHVFAYPRWAARIVNRPLTFSAVTIVGAVLLVLCVLIFGNPMPSEAPVQFRNMFPHLPLIVLFTGVTVIAFLGMGLGLRRIWMAWQSGTESVLPWRCIFLGAIRAFTDTLLSRRFNKCETHRFRGVTHGAVLFGFVGLAIIAGIAALQLALNGEAEHPLLSPFKIAANIFAVAFIVGLIAMMVMRFQKRRKGIASRFFDWAFLSNLLVIGVTGVGCEGLRYADYGLAAYIVYFVHLTAVLLFIALLPYTKLAHAVYRFAAEIFRNTDNIEHQIEDRCTKSHVSSRPRPVSVEQRLQPERAPCVVDPTELVNLSDDVVIDGYNRLRDQSVPMGQRQYYPGIAQLFDTPFEREKDRRETAQYAEMHPVSPIQKWYEDAADRSCVWWIENHLLMRHSLKSCMFCGMCTSVCPAAEHYPDYNPREIIDVALSRDESLIQNLLRSESIWYCGQCGSCKERCTRGNSPMGVISSLRHLAEIKGFHLETARGRQQYVARHLWGANFWNRGCSLYFRNVNAENHPDFGPRYQAVYDKQDANFLLVGAHPDRDGVFGGRKINPETLEELRLCALAGGGLYLWHSIDAHASADAEEQGVDLETYLDNVRKEG